MWVKISEPSAPFHMKFAKGKSVVSFHVIFVVQKLSAPDFINICGRVLQNPKVSNNVSTLLIFPKFLK